jgi:beta-galactosidase
MWDQFHYGVCYYPEHWPTDRHESDIRRIAAAGFDFVRMGEGAWGYFEPREGTFQFDLFDRAIDLCRQNGIRVILGTPTYCAPAWVSHRYPDVLRWNFDRVPMAHGSRRNLNYSSPRYLELSDRICTALAEHYKDEEQVIGWQLDNEFNCHMDVSYSPADTAAFRQWLAERFGSLAALNQAWGTAFWSQQYDDWQQIDLPHPTAAMLNPHQLLDETRFISDGVIRFARRQAAILRAHNPRWKITHNGLFANVDGPALAAQLDFFSHDQYPLFYPDWTGHAAPLIQARSLSFPFAILEQQAGPGGQMHYLQRTPAPGQLRLWAWQSIAHGADMLSYFRWRTCPFGSEQHWHGLLEPDDQDNRRLAEVAAAGKEFRALPREFFRAAPTRAVALLRDFDNEANDRRINTFTGDGRWDTYRWATELLRAHFPVDMTWPTSDWAGYSLLIAPHLQMIDAALAKKLADFVTTGGVLLLGAQTGIADRRLHMNETVRPGLLRELAGVEIEDWTTLASGESREAELQLEKSTAIWWANVLVERLRPLPGSTAIATWRGDDAIIAGSPAVVRHNAGRGAVIYAGGYFPESGIRTLIDLLAPIAKIRPILNAPPEVEVISRQSATRRWIVAMNHSPEPKDVTNLTGRDVLSGQSYKGSMTLRPYAVTVIEPVR